MRDNELIQLFLPIINAELSSRGFSNVSVLQSNQPTMQGINNNPTVYFFKLDGKRYGYLGFSDEWDSDAETMVHTESQLMDATFQVSAWVTQNPATPNQYTSFDLVDEVASILQSQKTIVRLNSANVGILRISPVRNPYFTTDQDQFQAMPSFDFTLNYENQRVSESPIITPPINISDKPV